MKRSYLICIVSVIIILFCAICVQDSTREGFTIMETLGRTFNEIWKFIKPYLYSEYFIVPLLIALFVVTPLTIFAYNIIFKVIL
jgi:hypothetical protein